MFLKRAVSRIGRYVLGIVFVLCACSGAAFAEPVSDAHTQVELITDVNAMQPGTPFWVGLHMDMEGQWQNYWKNPGDSGLPTVIKWDLPKGFEAGEIHWPFPKRMDYPEITSYGYEDEVLLLSQITPGKDLQLGSRQMIKAHVTWLACGHICVPGKADLFLEMPVQNEEPSINGATRDLFNLTMADWPLQNTSWVIGAYDNGSSFLFHLIPPDGMNTDLTEVAFFPERNDLIDHRASQKFNKVKEGYHLKVPKPPVIYTSAVEVKGVLVSSQAWEGAYRALLVNEPIHFQEKQ